LLDARGRTIPSEGRHVPGRSGRRVATPGDISVRSCLSCHSPVDNFVHVHARNSHETRANGGAAYDGSADGLGDLVDLHVEHRDAQSRSVAVQDPVAPAAIGKAEHDRYGTILLQFADDIVIVGATGGIATR
jgi:hypothetical protein